MQGRYAGAVNRGSMNRRLTGGMQGQGRQTGVAVRGGIQGRQTGTVDRGGDRGGKQGRQTVSADRGGIQGWQTGMADREGGWGNEVLRRSAEEDCRRAA